MVVVVSHLKVLHLIGTVCNLHNVSLLSYEECLLRFNYIKYYINLLITLRIYFNFLKNYAVI